MATDATTPDHETRQRLLDAAIRLFSEHGFEKVTVRDICTEANANIAAVNYYFRDKLGLYKEVVAMAADDMDKTKVKAMGTAEGSPEERLRTYIRGFLHRLLGCEERSWTEMLMQHEFKDPTPAFDLIVHKGIVPHALRLCQLMGEVMDLPPSDARVQFCASMIQGQCLFFRTAMPVNARIIPGFKYTPESIDQLARRIADFSLAGISALACEPGPQPGLEWGPPAGAGDGTSPGKEKTI